jgi:hypothetical protein
MRCGFYVVAYYDSAHLAIRLAGQFPRFSNQFAYHRVQSASSHLSKNQYTAPRVFICFFSCVICQDYRTLPAPFDTNTAGFARDVNGRCPVDHRQRTKWASTNTLTAAMA